MINDIACAQRGLILVTGATGNGKSTLQECIRDEQKHGDILRHIASGRKMYGMQTFDQHLADLVTERKVSMEEAKMHASRPEEFGRSMLVE